MRKYLLSLFISVFTMCAALAQVADAQIHITGKVIDTITREPLVGATIVVKGTTTATTASLDGSFKLKVPTGDQIVVVTFVGYVSKTYSIGSTDQSLGTIELAPNSSNMKEVVITGDVAIDRKTPVAVSTISAQFIDEHVGANDIPELLKGIPGVMTTEQGGGYGDSRVSIRGFSSRSGNGNVAYTINGIPVNDPETGALYFSDFSGLTDVASSIQVQRGLGASKIITPSFGGTINITTKSTDSQPGGYIYQGIGTNGWNKTALMISTGLTPSGWAATFQGSRTEGQGFADGLNFLGYNYFFNLSKVINSRQTISLNVIGATQTHGQRAEEPLADYQNAPNPATWNYYNGVKDGKEYNPYNNYYSEPLISINHEWAINSKSSLSTVLYTMIGNGGGGNLAGTTTNLPRENGSTNTATNIYTPIDFDAIQRSNGASADGSSATYVIDSHDQTNWYGLRSTYRTTLGKYIDLSAGIDLRYYTGNHYEAVKDLLGGDYVAYNYSGTIGNTAGDINNPNERAVVGSKIDYYNKDYVESGGAFAQAEYSKNDFTAFATLAGSENADKRSDFFNYLNSDPAQTSRWVSFTTYQAKIGANYNLNSQMNVFANIGYLTKPPYFAGVFQDYTNVINKNPVSEKLFSYELGYEYKISTFSATVNLYRTSYKDRAFDVPEADAATNEIYTANITGVDELHQGAELELKYRPVKEFLIGGMLSLGDYHYTQNAGPVNVYTSTGSLYKTVSEVYLKGEKIGDIAQDLAQVFAEVNLVPQLKIGVTGNYYAHYTAYVPFENYTSQNLHPYVIPNYAIWDANAVYKFKMAGFDAQLVGTVNNLLNSHVIQDAEDAGASGTVSNLTAYYSLERRFTTALKIRF